jgi:Phage integrase family
VLPELRTILDATPSGHLTFLTTAFGTPFTAAGFGNWFRDRLNAAGLPQCTFHGLRKAAARRLAEEGCTPHEIASITGRATLKEIERYTKAASRKQLAVSAMKKVRQRHGGWLTVAKVCQSKAKIVQLQRSILGVAPRAGFEPATNRLTAGCSTAELPGNSTSRARNAYNKAGRALKAAKRRESRCVCLGFA